MVQQVALERGPSDTGLPQYVVRSITGLHRGAQVSDRQMEERQNARDVVPADGREPDKSQEIQEKNKAFQQDYLPGFQYKAAGYW